MHDIRTEVEGVVAPDKRLAERFKKLTLAAWKAPSASYPKMLGDIANLEGAYRLLNNPRVTFDMLHRPHRERTIDRARDAGDVVVVHDTTDIRTPYIDESEAGHLSTSQLGYRAHVSLAQVVQPDQPVRPLGILGVQTIFRPKQSKRKAKRSSGAQTARWKDKEFARWAQGVELSAQAIKDCESVVHVMDREADSYLIFLQVMQLGHGFVIRQRNDRRARLVDDEDAEEMSSLGKIAIGMKGVFQREVPLARRKAQVRSKISTRLKVANPPRQARIATLHFSTESVEVCKPRYLTDVPESLSLTFVRIWEPKPPEGQAPIEWLLLTNEPCETTAEIARIVDLYRSRWVIEEFFKALKTGCAIEERQLESRDALLKSLALFLPIAVHLLWVRTCARDTSDAPATNAFTPLQLTVLRNTSYRGLPENPTISQAFWALAGLGGHIPNNGPPGWQLLGFAFVKLLEAVRVWEAAMRVAARPTL